MKKKTDSSTLHNSFVKGSQENLQENVTGANSLPTQAPTEFDKSVIVQSSPEEFDAVAKSGNNIVHNNMKNAIKYCNRKSKNKRRLEELPDWRVISSDMPQSVVNMCKNYDEYISILREKTLLEQKKRRSMVLNNT